MEMAVEEVPVMVCGGLEISGMQQNFKRIFRLFSFPDCVAGVDSHHDALAVRRLMIEILGGKQFRLAYDCDPVTAAGTIHIVDTGGTGIDCGRQDILPRIFTSVDIR